MFNYYFLKINLLIINHRSLVKRKVYFIFFYNLINILVTLIILRNHQDLNFFDAI